MTKDLHENVAFDLRSVPAIVTAKDVETVERWMAGHPPPFTTTFELLQWAAQCYASAPALRFLPTPDPRSALPDITYLQIADLTARAASLFLKLGGERPVVSSLLPNVPQAHTAIWGAQAVGAIAPLNPFLEVEILAELMTAVGTNILVVPSACLSPEIWTKAISAAAQVVTLRGILVVGGEEYAAAPVSQGVAPVLDFDTEVRKCAPITSSPRVASDVCALFHTGGTTGRPKIVRHTHANEVANALGAAAAFPGDRGEVCFVGLPLFHVNAVIGTGLCSLLKGQTILLGTPQGFRTPGLVQAFWRIVDAHQVSMFSAVPTVLSMLLDSGGDRPFGVSLRHVVSGAAPLSVTLAERFIAHTGATLVESYGLTEGGCISTLNPIRGEKRIGSIGMRLPGQQIRIVKFQTDGAGLAADCAPRENGIVLIKGANVSPGYLDERHCDGVFLADGWLNTGDIGYIDEDGYLWLTGREKDLIIRGGHNIDPAIIEEAMMHHPAVANAAAVGQPDAHAGELPCVFIQLRADAEDINPSQLAEHAREHIAERAAVPVHVTVMSDLPVTAVGKVFKPALRRIAAERVVQGLVAALDPAARVTVQVVPTGRDSFQIETVATDRDLAEVLGPLALNWRRTGQSA
jgi:fatty-acyl-CoA synthase